MSEQGADDNAGVAATLHALATIKRLIEVAKLPRPTRGNPFMT